MKTLYTIALFFFSFAIAFSQADKRFVHDEFQVPKSKKTEFQNDDYLVEKVMVYSNRYNKNKYSYYYDNQQNILTCIKEIWDLGIWINSEKWTYTYDTNNNILSLLYEKWFNEKWENEFKKTYRYNNNGNLLYIMYENWDNDRWINSKRDSYTYDNYGNKLTWLIQSWSYDQWANYQRYTYEYEINDSIHSVTYEKMENRWVNQWRKTYSYDIFENRKTYLKETWWKGEWTGSSRNIYTYDENNNLIYELRENYYSGQDLWKYYDRKTYTYDVIGNLLTQLNERCNNEIWSYSFRYTFTYNQNGNKLSHLYEEWHMQWKNIWRYIYTYDVNENMLSLIYEKWDINKWINYDYHSLSFKDSYGNYYGSYMGYKLEITWKNITSVENEFDDSFSIRTFPNPFTNSTTIKYTLDKPANVRINIYDNLGNRINNIEKYQEAGEHQAIFNAENYPSGMYYYTIQIGDQIYNRKLLLIK